ncbi:paralemmin 1a [Chanos chanos]|uniref:Paralemmin-1 n=1 Tax=Chanos chanos TaxID=29144 RepID=A0A6J2W9I4_CHACN|nr:paralemmin-1 [Chanos chanos]
MTVAREEVPETIDTPSKLSPQDDSTAADKTGPIPETLTQQERLQALAEKRKRQTEIDNKKRQLEDDRRQLQHLKSKALRDRWLLDGGLEEEEAKRQLQEDEAKTRGLEETILQLEQDLSELEMDVSVISSSPSTVAKLSKSQQEETRTTLNLVLLDEIKEITDIKVQPSPHLDKARADMLRTAMYSVEITVERDMVMGQTKVLSTSTQLPKDLSKHGVKVYEDEQKVVHEVRGMDGVLENGVHTLSSSEVDDLLHKADEVILSAGGGAMPQSGSETIEREEPLMKAESAAATESPTTKKEITGLEAKAGGAELNVDMCGASEDHPVTMVFMGYQSVEDEDETKKVLGLEGTVTAEVVVIQDGEGKTQVTTATEVAEQAPPNGSTADPPKAPEMSVQTTDPDEGATELSKKKQPCKCCVIM